MGFRLHRLGLAGLLLLLPLLLWPAAPARAQALPGVTTAKPATPAIPTIDPAQAKAMAATLQDPVARQKLIDQLNVLAAAQPPKPAPPPATGLDLGSMLGDTLDAGRDALVSAGASFPRINATQRWLGEQFTAEGRAEWGSLLIRLAVILGLPGVAALLARGLLGRPREGLDRFARRSRAAAFLAAAGRWLIELVVVALFAVAAALLSRVPVLEPDGPAAQLVVLLIAAIAAAQAGLTLAHALLRPDQRTVRPVPLGDALALRLQRWWRWLLLTQVIGICLVESLARLGLPYSGRHLVALIVGLVFTILLVTAIMQCRRPMAAWLRNRKGALASFRGQFAAIWHLPVVLYVVGTFLVWALNIPGGFSYLLLGTAGTVLVAVAVSALLPALDRLSSHASRKESARLARYANLVAVTGRVAIVGLALLVLLQVWGVGVTDAMASPSGRKLVGTLATVAVILVVSVVAWEMVTAEIERHLSRLAPGQTRRDLRLRTLLPLLRNVLLIVILLIAALTVLDQVGVNIGPLLAGAGVVGVAVGFGSQKLVQDVITGAFILFEDTISVGDSVNVGAYAGTVESMSIRSLRLRDANGVLHTVPFSAVTGVSNSSRDFSFATLNVAVPPRSDIARVGKEIEAIGQGIAADDHWSDVITGPFTLVGIDKFENNAILLVARVRTRIGRADDVRHEFNWRLKQRFDALGITLANLPQSTLLLGSEKDLREPDSDPDEAGQAPRKSAAKV